MQPIDLHVHSTYSDGTVTPTKLVEKAIECNLAAMALTDHDTTAGIPEAISAAKGTGLELIPGIELSCNYGGFKEIHIVGLYIDYNNDELNEQLKKLQDNRERRNIEMAERFANAGIHISYDEMKQLYHDAVLTRAHFADYLLRHDYVRSRKEAFDRYLNDNAPCYVPRRQLAPSDGIRLIINSGGVPVLAHPTLYHLGDDVMNRMLADLKADGLTGIECIYSTYTMGEEIYMRTLAKKYGLIISGGSDYHGDNKPAIQLGTGRGNLFIPEELLTPIRSLRT